MVEVLIEPIAKAEENYKDFCFFLVYKDALKGRGIAKTDLDMM